VIKLTRAFVFTSKTPELASFFWYFHDLNTWLRGLIYLHMRRCGLVLAMITVNWCKVRTSSIYIVNWLLYYLFPFFIFAWLHEWRVRKPIFYVAE